MKHFIGAYKINEKICDQIVNYYKNNKDLQQSGNIENKKKSTEILIKPKQIQKLDWGKNYYKSLNNCLNKYFETYEHANQVQPFDVTDNFKIQYYKPGEGFKAYHKENNGNSNTFKRHLVFMTYLNTVKNAGTDFLYQELKCEAIKGITLIWPAAWTHTHRGIVSNNQEKFIITGWVNFY